MAMNKNTTMANRYGLDTKLYAYTDGSVAEEASEIAVIPFANVSNISIEGDTVWATGYASHGNQVGFNDPLTGSFTISTQMVTPALLQILAGKSPANFTGTDVVFENTDETASSPYFTITSETVWQDESGTKYSQNITFHKAKVARTFNIEYSGTGDPLSIDVEFELAEDESGKLATFSTKEKSE